jgi:hypothetical protein
LIIPFARGAVGYGVCAHIGGNFHHAFGNEGTGDRCAQQIFTLVNGVGAEHGKNIIPNEFLAQIVDENLFGTQFFGLNPGGFQFLTLPNIGSEGDDVALILILQPFENHRGIQTAGISEDDFLDHL